MVKVQSFKTYLINLNYTDSVADANSSVKFLAKKIQNLFSQHTERI
jgi:hypothetical protein